MATPVSQAKEGFEYISYFLNSIFGNIIFFLVFLSIMLIYSLMVADVDGKTYEMGMLRALGLKQRAIIYLISL